MLRKGRGRHRRWQQKFVKDLGSHCPSININIITTARETSHGHGFQTETTFYSALVSTLFAVVAGDPPKS